MSTYTYAVIDSAQAIEPSLGLFGTPVRNLPCRRLGVVVSELPEGEILRTAERIIEHSAVADRLMAGFTVLPIRFGTIFPDRDRVIANAEEHYTDFCLNLDRLRAKVEFGLRVLWPGEAVMQEIELAEPVRTVPGQPGSVARQFLEAKLAQYRLDQAFATRAEQAIAEIDRAFHPIAAEKECERLKTPNLLLSACYLVQQARIGEFHQAYERLRSGRPDFRYLLSGPWPPYSFVKMPPPGVAAPPGPCHSWREIR